MRWNPILNALAAAVYITAVSLVIHYISSIRHDTPDTILDSIAALSLAVFSAATMGFLFFYRPVALLIEGKKSEALSYFLKTLLTFGIITVLAFIALLK